MRSLLMTALGSVALLGFSAPAMAQFYDPNDEHHEQHDQLGEEHHDVHDQLGEVHEEVHEQGISGYDDRRVHQQLNRAHQRADGNIAAEHYYEHQQNQSGYGGYNNGYGYGYAAPPSYYGYSAYGANGRGYGYSRYRVRHPRHNRYRGY